MKRSVISFLMLVSLLLCVGTVALGVFSHRRGSLAGWEGEAWTITVRTENGTMAFYWSRSDAVRDEETPLRGLFWTSWPNPARGGARDWPGWWQRMGFGYAVGGTAGGEVLRQMWMPYWSVAAASGVLSGVWGVIAWRRRRRKREGKCRICGYDLRATPERCPECGTEAAVR